MWLFLLSLKGGEKYGHFNFAGDPATVSQSFIEHFVRFKREKGIKEESFFKQTQLAILKVTVYILKRLYGDAVNLQMLRNYIRELDALNELIETYGERIGRDDFYRFFRGYKDFVEHHFDRYAAVANLLDDCVERNELN